MSRLIRSRARSDSGNTLIIVALTIIVLMIFTAFAVDLGGLTNARRLDQNAADSGALGGAQELSNTSNIVTTVDTLVSDTMGIAHGTLNWATGCVGSNTDSDKVDIAVSGTTTGSSCITLDSTGRFLQVRIPEQQYETAFGRVVGLNSFSHTAMAIAGIKKGGFGSVLPYAIGLGAGGGDGYECIKTGASGHTGDAVCDGADSGNFGYVNFAFFGSAEVNTATDCGNGNQRNRNINNTAVGVDHDLSIYGKDPHGFSVIVDTDTPCASIEKPNSMEVLTGNTPQDFGTGIYSGDSSVFTDGNPARLQRTDSRLFGGSGSKQNVAGYQLDNNALWNFITPGLSTSDDVPSSCLQDQFMGANGVFESSNGWSGDDLQNLPESLRNHISSKTVGDGMRALLERCFTHYIGGHGSVWTDNGAYSPGDTNNDCATGGGECSGVVFGRNSSTTDQPDLYDIQYTSRFGYVPQLDSSFPSGGSAPVHIAGFRAVYLQRLLAGQCSGSGGCDHSFDPGVNCNCTSTATKADGITAFIFPRTMLPNGLAEDDAAFSVGKNRFIELVR